MQRQTRA